MQAELTLTGTRRQLAAFQQTTQAQAVARLDELAEDPWERRLVQHAVIALCARAAWSGTEDHTTLTLAVSGQDAAVRDAAETLHRQAQEQGLKAEIDLQADAGDAQGRAEEARCGRRNAD